MTDIQKHRKKIDQIDDKILTLLCQRVSACKGIGEEKKKQGMPVHDAARETEVYQHIKQKAVQLGLDSGQVEAVYREIVNMCSAVQE